ncbi:hypothetical protein TURU_044598 [Turdus rufiventris]|nr:hypothetical protein TURU_044598 [Turdus rufiventris]
MERVLPLLCCHCSLLLLIQQERQVCANDSQLPKHPGFKVLASASHYWPLEDVDGIHEFRDTNGALRIHNFTVLPSHNSTFVNTNDSAYSNFSATVDIVEGMVNKGIYVTEKKGVTFLFFGSYRNSCISNPEACGPEGVTFSFFWKTQDQQAKLLPASGGRVISSGFKICSNEGEGSVEFYTRGNAMMKWKASFSPPGPYWTHILFTWQSREGLKVYVNGTLNTTDPAGKVFYDYGDTSANLLTGTEGEPAKRFVNGAFDEFIIWERALSPQEVQQYFTAAIGVQVLLSSTLPWSLMTTTTKPVAFLKAVEDFMLLSDWIDGPETPEVFGSLIHTIDTVMAHLSLNLHGSSLTLEGSSSVADYAVVRIHPQTLNASHYRFPSRGLSYISIPSEAFHGKAWITIVGLLYHNMHYFFHNINPADTREKENENDPDLGLSLANSRLKLLHFKALCSLSEILGSGTVDEAEMQYLSAFPGICGQDKLEIHPCSPELFVLSTPEDEGLPCHSAQQRKRLLDLTQLTQPAGNVECAMHYRLVSIKVWMQLCPEQSGKFCLQMKEFHSPAGFWEQKQSLILMGFPRIAEAAAYKDCMISASSYLISIKVEPLPQLSYNLSGAPVLSIQLSHRLTFCSVIPCLNNCTVTAIPDVLFPTIEHGRVSGSGLKDLQMPEFHFSSVISSLKGDDLHSKAELESFCYV